MTEYLPEGELIGKESNRLNLKSLYSLQECIQTRKILEAPCIICDNEHNLIVDLGIMKGIIPRIEGAVGIDEGYTKDIALISRVNKPVCFKIISIGKNKYGGDFAILSRRKAQQECYSEYISGLQSGDIINAKVTHLESFGAFVDIGCGIPSLIPIDAISVSRISHPSDRFTVGQNIKAVIKSIEQDKISLTHKELLGTWQENADSFSVGETVVGIVRSVEDYGIFVELKPNLAGLAELKEGVCVNQHASVYIKAIIPEKMKIKLIIVDSCEQGYTTGSFDYFISGGHIDSWDYSTENSSKNIRSVF